MFSKQLAVLGVAALCFAAPAAAAQHYLDGSQALVRDFGDDGVVVIYWTATPHGIEVVTQLNMEDRTVLRVTGLLQEGQSQRISMPRLGRRQPTLVILRIADTIMVDSYMEATDETLATTDKLMVP